MINNAEKEHQIELPDLGGGQIVDGAETVLHLRVQQALRGGKAGEFGSEVIVGKYVGRSTALGFEAEEAVVSSDIEHPFAGEVGGKLEQLCFAGSIFCSRR